MDRNTMKHESLDCTDIKALLSAYIDDEMDSPTRHLVERHLAECDACRALVNEAEGLDDLIAIDAEAREQLIRPSEEFQEQVLARTAYAQRPHRNSRWAMWTGWMTAAACLGLAGVIWMGDIPGPGEQYAEERTSSTQQDPAASGETTDQSPVIRPAAYTTGFDLQSETYEGSLPVEVFQLTGTRRISPLVPRPGAGWTQPQQDRTTMPALAESSQSLDAPQGAIHFEQLDQLREPRDGRLQQHEVAVMSRGDLKTLHSTAQLMEFLEGIDLSSFSEVEWMRQVIEMDELLERLHETRDRVSIEHRPAVYAAEAIIHRIADGPLDQQDVKGLRDMAIGLDLVKEISRISRRPNDVPSL